MKRYFRVQPRCIFLDAMSPIATSDGLSWRRQERYFVTQLTGDAQSAVYAVNAMEHNPTACALIDVVYFRGPRIEVARHGDSAFEIARILVVGIKTAISIQAVRPAAYFSLFGIKEYAV
jgi:uncharacterized MAPEG superfamily protein